jgi:hypothetical protein
MFVGFISVTGVTVRRVRRHGSREVTLHGLFFMRKRANGDIAECCTPIDGDFLVSRLWDQLMMRGWRERAMKKPGVGPRKKRRESLLKSTRSLAHPESKVPFILVGRSRIRCH